MKLECSTATTPHSHVRSSASTTTMSRGRRRSKGRSNNNPLLMAMATAQGGGSAVKLLSTAHRLPSFSFHPKLVFGNYNYSHNNKMMMKMGSLGGKESSHLTSSSDDDNDEDEFERDELSSYRGLVVDISYRPINVVCWRRAICLEFLDKADVLEYYDQTVDSPSGSFYIPAVLRVPNLLQVVKRRRIKQNLSRKNIFLRDDYICQYCSSGEHLTVDHLLPISRGGEWTWENLVTACAKCNSRKGHKTLEEANMKLIKVPKAPKDFDLIAIPLTNAALRALKRRNALPNEWNQYLGKPSTEP